MDDWALMAECKLSPLRMGTEWAGLSAEQGRGKEEAREDMCLGTWHRITQDAQSGHFCVFRGQTHGMTQHLAHTLPLFFWLL